MILPNLPAFDLLVLQQVNKTWEAIIKKSKIIQMKLFMKQDPPEEQWGKAFGANGLRWNPFLEHYGRPRKPNPGSHKYRVRIERKHLRKIHRPRASKKEILRGLEPPEPSWKKMYVSYPTRLKIRADLIPHTFRMASHDCRYTSKEEAMRMEFLERVDKKCISHGHWSERDFFDIDAGY